MGVDNVPVPVRCNGHDGQGGHEHSYAREGLDHPEKEAINVLHYICSAIKLNLNRTFKAPEKDVLCISRSQL